MPKIRVGVVGVGSIGDVHLAGYAAHPSLATIQAICDVNRARLDAMGEKYGVAPQHRYTKFEHMLEREELDCLSVCTPNCFHYPYAAAALDRGIATLIEKPITIRLEDAQHLAKIVARSGAKAMVAFSHRFIGMNIAAKKVLDSGGIGKPFMIRVRYAHRGPYPGWAQGDWFYRRKLAGGGALLDMGIHAIDICHYLIGPITSVSAEVKTLRKDIEVDDNAVLIVDFGPARALGYIECGWTSPPGFSGIEIYGDEGTLILDLVNGPKWIRGVTRPDGTTRTELRRLPVPKGPSHWPFQMDCWVKYVAGKRVPVALPQIQDGVRSLAVALAAMESSKTGKRIRIPKVK
ncbi:MAG: dehydrogenase [Candidatus Sumerlaea sp.]|nr:MAG: dehydrogenase [Candidatus Sumerlaea sp.]